VKTAMLGNNWASQAVIHILKIYIKDTRHIIYNNIANIFQITLSAME